MIVGNFKLNKSIIGINLLICYREAIFEKRYLNNYLNGENNMKKLLSIFAVVAFAFSAHAGTLDDVKNRGFLNVE